MLARDPDLLPLQATEEPNTIVSSRVVLTTVLLLTLPLEDETGVTEGGRLEEVVAGGEWEEEREVLREVEGPVR